MRLNLWLKPETLTARFGYFSGFFCASRSISASTVLNCTLLSPILPAAIIQSARMDIFPSVKSFGSISTIAEVVPGVRLVGNFAIEFKSADSPLKSLPCIGDTLYAIISPDRLPSEVAAQQMVIEAAANRDLELAFKAFVNDPLVTIDHVSARALFDEMVENTKAYLTEYFK